MGNEGSATDTPETDDVVRARRFEVIDSEGRVRATLGTERPLEHAEAVAVSLLTPEGVEVASLRASDDGVALELVHRGNVVAHLGFHVPSPEDGALLVTLNLCDVSGRPIVGWTIDGGGDPDHPLGDR